MPVRDLPAREYYLAIDGERFDSRAIIGVVHACEFPRARPLRSDQFSGGTATVAPKLRELGFVVERGPDAATEVKHGTLSELLSRWLIYTWDDLKQIPDAGNSTINTGIFKPAGYASVLIFITKNKTADPQSKRDDCVIIS